MRNRRRAAPAGAALLLGLALLAGCSDVEATGDAGYVSADGQLTEYEPADRGEPIVLEGEDLEGQPLSLEDFRGTPVVVNVWGSWCPPCRAEAPDLVEAADQLGDSAVFVGINNRDSSTAQAQSFEREYEVEYPSFYSPDGRALLAFAGSLSPRAIPSTTILDSEGRVAATIVGRVPSATTVVTLVETVIDEEGGAGEGDG
ncbi:TlpA disulfide reductase family protein [Nocardioides zeae]|uniref:TlpA family protein disulfide reductase n=1 Tax=Nocardioides zeae TaxID=1457234 RepID=A0A6P0HP35_9ACTN|nr:TlpA disulfide reductase family protein [Nocardioides zeae]NEN80398.1 TlpA family protein disulfide reductase [Nocardioides zeae]